MSIMGNILENKMSSDKPMAVVNPMPAVSDVAEQQEKEQSIANISLQVFQYRQHMGQKKNQVIKWASSKLMLTEELLKQHQPKSEQVDQNIDEDSDAAWAQRQLALLTDEDEDSNDENKYPFLNALDNEMYRLKKYRTKLHCTIYRVAQEKLKKREKVKLKRLKRRTLISSKKPSNKDKHRY